LSVGKLQSFWSWASERSRWRKSVSSGGRHHLRHSEPAAVKNGVTLAVWHELAAIPIGGKLAQLGQRHINGRAKKMADGFFANLARAF
jgi:hypothetical protein